MTTCINTTRYSPKQIQFSLQQNKNLIWEAKKPNFQEIKILLEPFMTNLKQKTAT